MITVNRSMGPLRDQRQMGRVKPNDRHEGRQLVGTPSDEVQRPAYDDGRIIPFELFLDRLTIGPVTLGIVRRRLPHRRKPLIKTVIGRRRSRLALEVTEVPLAKVPASIAKWLECFSQRQLSRRQWIERGAVP